MAKREIPKLQVAPRPRLGKRYSLRLRKEGKLPAVIYGHKQDPVHVALDRKAMTDLLHRNTHLLEVALDAHTEPCLVKDVQWDHLGAHVIHVDLARVDLTERVKVDVSVELTGEAVGLKEAGTLLEQYLAEIEVECLATDIPDAIKADVSHLGVEDSLLVKDIKLPEGVSTTASPEAIVAAVHTIKEEVEPVAAAEGTAAEPEVIGKKAEEGAEGEAAPASGGGGGGAAKGGEKK